MKNLLRFLYVLFELCLLFLGGIGIYGVVCPVDIIMTILCAILIGIAFGGFIAILIILIKDRHYLW